MSGRNISKAPKTVAPRAHDVTDKGSSNGSSIAITTARNLRCTVQQRGPKSGPPLVHLHGTFGIEPDLAYLDALAELGWRVHAPVLPGYGEDQTESELRDLLDFTLHGWDLLDALGLTGALPVLSAHSFGAMIAAEMAAMAPSLLGRLVLVAPLGVWLDERPIPDIFALLPYELAQVLFSDPATGIGALTNGADVSDAAVFEGMLVRNARRLGTAGKLLFPIPNRGFAGRAYRVSTPTTLIWGDGDRLVPAEFYAHGWSRLISHAAINVVPATAHMCTYENPGAVAALVGPPVG